MELALENTKLAKNIPQVYGVIALGGVVSVCIPVLGLHPIFDLCDCLSVLSLQPPPLYVMLMERTQHGGINLDYSIE